VGPENEDPRFATVGLRAWWCRHCLLRHGRLKPPNARQLEREFGLNQTDCWQLEHDKYSRLPSIEKAARYERAYGVGTTPGLTKEWLWYGQGTPPTPTGDVPPRDQYTSTAPQLPIRAIPREELQPVEEAIYNLRGKVSDAAAAAARYMVSVVPERTVREWEELLVDFDAKMAAAKQDSDTPRPELKTGPQARVKAKPEFSKSSTRKSRSESGTSEAVDDPGKNKPRHGAGRRRQK
jgi:hypothetical protein